MDWGTMLAYTPTKFWPALLLGYCYLKVRHWRDAGNWSFVIEETMDGTKHAAWKRFVAIRGSFIQ
jgi:hypothetical protein